VTGEDEVQLFGLYRGKVHGTADPEKRGRLQITVPTVNGGAAFDWALPCFPYLTQQPKLVQTTANGADSRGDSHNLPVTGKTEKITLRIPKRGDPVWVMFENGSPTKPVWLGTWIGM